MVTTSHDDRLVLTSACRSRRGCPATVYQVPMAEKKAEARHRQRAPSRRIFKTSPEAGSGQPPRFAAGWQTGFAGLVNPTSAGQPGRGAGRGQAATHTPARSEEHTSELQSLRHLVCRLLLE